MMTSAPSYTAAPAGLPSPALSDTGADCPDPAQLSLRLVKRPLVGQPLDACKKRRKQSTPIRISTTESNAAVDDSNGDGESDIVSGVGAAATIIGASGTPFLPHSPVPQNRSPVGGSTPTTLMDYATRDHGEQLTAGSEQDENNDGSLMPTGIGRSQVESPISRNALTEMRTSSGALLPAWMPDPTQGPKPGEQADWSPLQSMAIAGTAPLYLSHLPQSELQAQSRNPNQPSIRIFNPEAYCELCNKEFCNKYFLKTHKANKHRIYTDPPASEILMNIPSFSAPALTPTSAPTQIIKKPNSVMLNVDVTKSNDIPKTTSTFNCDICNKGFTYKILLKNHKKNVHGIACESESGGEVEAEVERQMMKCQEEREPGQLDSLVSEEESLSKNSAFFKNGLPVDMPLVKEEATYLEQDDSSFNVTNNCKMSPVPIGTPSRESAEISINRLRRMGIMNPEAFCEICCKEYCNKYFLRTHKMKRHGILIPDDGIKDGQKQEQSPVSNNWYQIQTSPLNLIMGEQNTNSSGSCGERKSSPTNENECDMCGMRFQTAYLAQLHASVNCKGKPLSDISEPPIKLENSNISNTTNNNEKYSVSSSADAISEDLQKLQSMILQLNNLGENKTGNGGLGTMCNLCSKELENKYFLQAHMMAEHSILLEESAEEKREREIEIGSSEMCKLCGREGFTTQEAFKQHMLECHSPVGPDLKEDSNDHVSTDGSGKPLNPERRFASQVSAERRSSISLTPTSSYCEICNKELCNKYFMKTHMQRMHGIEIENGAQIGGVVCNICNKELCSKYFLRVHKHNTHGIVEEGAGSTSGQPRQIGVEMESGAVPLQQAQPPSEPTDNALKPDLADLSHRYFSHFSEVCSICSRRFRSTKWLKAHLLGDHGKAGTEKWNELEMQLQQSFGQQQRSNAFSKTASSDRIASPMLKIPNGGGISTADKVPGVQNVLSSLFGTDESNAKHYYCSFCSFSTPVLAFLFVHERSHAQESETGPLQCAVCKQTFRQPELLQRHVLSQHPFLPIAPLLGNVLQQCGSGQPKTTVAMPPSPQPETTQISAVKTPTPPPERTDPEERCTNCSQCKNGTARKQTVEIGLSLKDVSKQCNLPATYALPQTITTAKYVMQAFLMDEPAKAASAAEQQQMVATGGTTTADRKFAPSIVFLPVLERQNAPLTVSFTLTPT